MVEHQAPYAESTASDDTYGTTTEKIADEPSPAPTHDNEPSTEPTQKDESDENGLDELVSSGGEELLAFVDEIRQIDGLSHVQLDLPQLVVVGNTSSGKSSLLQAIIKLPFPVSPDLCTHFATETIIQRCRPSSRPSYKISVRCPTTGEALYPDEFPKSYTGEKWTDVSRHLKSDIIDAFKFMKSKQKAKKDAAEKLADHEVTTPPSVRLQEDIMTIEVAKIDQAHFSVVDIPGLVSYGAEADVKLSERLAKKYIRNKRAIPLTVLSAVDAFDNQKVLQLVREAGSTSRCLGVITKCDMVQDRDELIVLDVLKHPERYGMQRCYAVRNRSTKEIVDDGLSHAERDQKERSFFYDENGWQNAIGPGQLRIDNLRVCLAQSLYKQVVSSFPDLRNDMRNATKVLAKELKGLGHPRSTPEAQRQFLSGIQEKYQKCIEGSLEGKYQTGISDDHPSKLRYHVRKLCDEFDGVVRSEGFRHPFVDPRHGHDPQHIEPSLEKLKGEIGVEGGIYSWILGKWDSSQGSEAPFDVPTTMKQSLFQEQISSWPDLAEDHLTKVIDTIDECNNYFFQQVCPDVEIRQRIRDDLYAAETEAKERAEQELTNILLDHEQRIHTSDPRLKTNIDQAHAARTEMCVEKVQGHPSMQTNHITQTFESNQTISKQVYEIHDYLKAYCDIAMSRFLDNVAIQVVERHLLGRNGPLAAFTAQWKDGLKPEQLEALVGEKKETKVRREQLAKNLEVLKEAVGRADKMVYAC